MPASTALVASAAATTTTITTTTSSLANQSLSASAGGSGGGGGNAKYLRYVRSKLSKSRLNSVLSLAGSGGQAKELTGGDQSAPYQADLAAALSEPSELLLGQQLVASGAGPRVKSLAKLDVHRPVGVSLSSEPASGSSAGGDSSAELATPPEEGQVASTTGAKLRQQASVKKSTFFQGFRYTLRGRRGSKQRPQQQPTAAATTTTLATTITTTAIQNQTDELAAAATLQQSHSLSSISGGQSAQRSVSALGARHKLLHSDASTLAASSPSELVPELLVAGDTHQQAVEHFRAEQQQQVAASRFTTTLTSYQTSGSYSTARSAAFQTSSASSSSATFSVFQRKDSKR